LTADEIYKGAVNDMYSYCFSNNLSQVWAYMWNRWYMPKQWTLWARAACDAISRLKTTMVVENLWKHIKRRDLAHYNRPRLDLVTHLVITGVLPRVQLTLASILDRRRVGRPKALAQWQTDFRHHWKEMSLSDEERLVKKELAVRQGNLKGKKRDEKLEQIANEEGREHGQYYTSLQTWTCSCPSYLISRFLLCKHLVRLTNEKLQNKPLTQLKFFANLQRARYTPFYNIKGIHCDLEPDTTSSADEEEVEIIMLGGYGMRSVTENEHSSLGISNTLDKEDPPSKHVAVVVDVREEGGLGTERTAAELQVDNEAGDNMSDCHNHDESNDPYATRVSNFGNHIQRKQKNSGKVYFAESRREHLKRCFEDMLIASSSSAGLHPKMGDILDHVFRQVEKVGSDLGKHKRRRKSPQTWKDSNENTLYLD
jgi:hypothetical protein